MWFSILRAITDVDGTVLGSITENSSLYEQTQKLSSSSVISLKNSPVNCVEEEANET